MKVYHKMDIQQTPVMGSIVSIRYMKFDFSHQFWATVKVPYGVIQARLCPEDFPRLTFAGYDVSSWPQRRNYTMQLPQPIEASFVFDGLVWTLCEAILQPLSPDPMEQETCEVIRETCYRKEARLRAEAEAERRASEPEFIARTDEEFWADWNSLPEGTCPEGGSLFNDSLQKDWEANYSK